jgi:hypothetical protein
MLGFAPIAALPLATSGSASSVSTVTGVTRIIARGGKRIAVKASSVTIISFGK